MTGRAARFACFDALEPGDPAERLMRSRQKWSQRLFRPDGGYFVGGGGTEWNDEHLYCASVMNAFDADEEIAAWMDFGLTPFVGDGEDRCWIDLCVAASNCLISTAGPIASTTATVGIWLSVSTNGFGAASPARGFACAALSMKHRP